LLSKNGFFNYILLLEMMFYILGNKILVHFE
jgi:hypothetical protein